MRYLIINADGYGFTDGISRAIEECIDFGTVRSLSANVNFPAAEGLRSLVRQHPFLSVGCHLNPVVGRPLLSPREVPTLVDREGFFHYRSFRRKFQRREIDLGELRAELLAQIDLSRDLVGDCFSHVDFHMGLHRLPRLYPLFLEVAATSGTGRVRTHRYFAGMESRHPRLRHAIHMLESPGHLPKYLWNLLLRSRARKRGFAMPDYWLSITNMGRWKGSISVETYRRLLANVPRGYSEFVVHPAHIDAELRKWSTYLDQRVEERRVLLTREFRDALQNGPAQLAGYRDLPAGHPHGIPEPLKEGRSRERGSASQ